MEQQAPAAHGGGPPPDRQAAGAGVPTAASSVVGTPARKPGAMPALPARPAANGQARAAAAGRGGGGGGSSAAAGNGPVARVSPPPAAAKHGAAAVPVRPARQQGAARAMPLLPVRVAPGAGAAAGSVIDPEEPPATQALRAKVHTIRVRLIRAARRLGYEHDNGLVKQVLYRLHLAEKLKEPFRKGSRRPDAALLAAREAERLEAEEGPNSPLGLHVKILVIGLRGTGKTQLIHSLLGMGGGGCPADAAPPDAFSGATRGVRVVRGCVHGVHLTLVDTPGLTASAAGTAANAAVLRALKKAFKQHQPDLALYVDRFDQPTRAGGELSVLQAVTNAVGAHVWLNTIVALTHAGSMPPAGGQGLLSYEAYGQQRSQLLQLIIRSASGDARLMNPIAYAESHPGCRRNAQGQAITPSGLAWQQHMMVLVVSAKLLADAEAALQMAPDAASSGNKLGAAAGLDAASMRQLMGRPEGPPVRYLMTQLTGFSQPLPYPDHGGIMELRMAKHRLRLLRGWRERKELSRQIRFRLLQMRQTQRRQQRTADLLCKATRAGGKLQLEQPRTATRTRPSVQPPVGHRYRALEPGAGWVVRPHIEPHGMDNADSVEGIIAEKSGVLRPGGGGAGEGEALLRGAPFRASASASAGKEQMLAQARGEVSLYHDLQGLGTTTLSADLQTSGAVGTPDMLVVLRLDSQRRGLVLPANNPSAGVMLARLAPDCRLHRGPLAAGVRLQDCLRVSGPGGAPVELDVAMGRMFCRPSIEPDDAWGANAELRTDARRLLGSRYSSPLSVSGSVLGHRGETMAAASAALQVQRGRRSGVGGKLQLNSRGIGTIGLQVRSDGAQWWALAGLVPLFNLGRDMLASALAGGGGGGTAGGKEQQQQQQQARPHIAAAAGQ